jgi:hypothetical protein
VETLERSEHPDPADDELTGVQRRTLEGLIRVRHTPPPEDVVRRLRARLERAMRELAPREPVFLTKARLTSADRCEGRFQAATLGEGTAFEHGPKTAGGLLMHRAIELDVGGRAQRDPRILVELAERRLTDEDRAFDAYLLTLDAPGRDELVMRTTGALELFRETFPPLRPMRAELAPITEWHLRAVVADGALILDGRIDLTLGRRPPEGTGRLLVDLKGEGAWPEHAEDMRFYALMHALRFDVPPARVATFFLASGEWQLEDVTERTLERAAARVIRAARISAQLEAGRSPALTPGRYCGWCPRRDGCPSAA